MNTRVGKTAPRCSNPLPYPRWEYVARFLWLLVRFTVWWLACRRLYFLRPGLLKLFGAKVRWKSAQSATCHIQRPWAVCLGEYSSIGPRVHIYNLGEFTLGDRSIVSQDVYICGGTHDYADPKYPLLRPPVVIEDDVWVCAGAFLGPGIKVGRGAVVGARAVVVKDVEPWTVVAGNPARVIKRRELKGL